MARFLSRQTLRTSGRPPRPRTALHTKVRAPTSASCARELETHQQSARPVPARVTSLPIFRLAGSLCTHASKRIKNGVDFQLISHTKCSSVIHRTVERLLQNVLRLVGRKLEFRANICEDKTCLLRVRVYSCADLSECVQKSSPADSPSPGTRAANSKADLSG